MIKTEKTVSTWKGNMRVEAQTKGHTVVIDQPGQMGGSDAGPTPMETLLVALGTCVSTVAAIVARQQQIPLRGFSIEVEGDFDMDYVMGKTETGHGGFTEIREIVHIDADLSEAEKRAFYEEVHRRCPVTGSLLQRTTVKYEVK